MINLFSHLSPDHRFGRNIARTLLEYYRFTNVLTIPMVSEVKSRKGRPKTHRSRSRKRREYTLQARPPTTRECAPISYTDLTMHCESSTSAEGSPARSGFGARSTSNYYVDIQHGDGREPRCNDYYSLYTIRTSKFQNLEFPNEIRRINAHKSQSPMRNRHFDEETISVVPRPSLSIIDFNQLTFGGIEKAKRNRNNTKSTN